MKSDEDFLTYTPNQPIPYYNVKIYSLLENIFKWKHPEITTKIPEQLLDSFLLSVNSPKRYNISITDEGAHYFMGYPDWNYLAQMAAILTLWNERSIFPVTFVTMSELDDNTYCEIERLNSLTQEVRELFANLTSSTISNISKLLKELLVLIDGRGVMTMFGLRTSAGSLNDVWPKKAIILEAINKQYKKR